MKVPYEAPYLKVVSLRFSETIMCKCNSEPGDSGKDDIGCGRSREYCKGSGEE